MAVLFRGHHEPLVIRHCGLLLLLSVSAAAHAERLTLATATPEPVVGHRFGYEPPLPRTLLAGAELARAGESWVSELQLSYGALTALQLNASLPGYTLGERFHVGSPRIGLGSWLPFAVPRLSSPWFYVRPVARWNLLVPVGSPAFEFGNSALSVSELRNEAYFSVATVTRFGLALTPWVQLARRVDYGLSTAFTAAHGEFAATLGVARQAFADQRETAATASASLRLFRGGVRLSGLGSVPLSGHWSEHGMLALALSVAWGTTTEYANADGLFEAVLEPSGDVRHLTAGRQVHSPATLVVRGRVTLVAFEADWCGPCRRLKPELVALARRHPEVVLWFVDADDHAELLLQSELGKQQLPFVLLYDGAGNERGRFVGFNSGAVDQAVERLLGSEASQSSGR